MAVELITFKMDSKLRAEVDRSFRSAGFQNRTEFIRTALREKIDEIKLKESMAILSKLRGKAKVKTTDAELEEIRERVSAEFFNKVR